MGEPEDRELVAATLAGDAAAFEELVRRYQRPLFNAAYRITASREDAVDATQSALVKAFDRLSTYRPEHRFFSWLFRIAVNESLDAVKRRGRFADAEPEEAELAAAGGREHDPETHLAARETADRVRRAIAALQPDYRVVLVLRHYQELSYREIADIVGAPEKTVKSRLFSARRELRQRLLPAHSS